MNGPEDPYNRSPEAPAPQTGDLAAPPATPSHDEGRKRVADEEWSAILGQTSAFLGSVQSIVGEEAAAPKEPRPPVLEEDNDIVAAFPRTLQTIAVSFDISGRSLARARAAYGEVSAPRLRLIAFSSRTPELILDEPIEVPGRGEREISLSRRTAFLLAAVGILDEQGAFHPLAHAAPLTLNPASIFPKTPLTSIWVDPFGKKPPLALLDRPAPAPPPDEAEATEEHPEIGTSGSQWR